MPKRQPIYTHKRIMALYQHRTLIALGIVIILTISLAIRMFYLQIMQHRKYSTLSKKNQMMVLPLPPQRGKIYDRYGTLLATNIPIYNLQILPDNVPDLADTLSRLQAIIDLTPEDIKHFQTLKRQHRRFENTTLKTKLSEAEVANFYVNQYFFPGVRIETQFIRYYPYQDTLASVIGYVGRINAVELATIDRSEYAGTDYFGKVGIEKYFENILHGKGGNQHVEVDASGRIIRVLQQQPPIAGHDLYLTIDLHLQQVAANALQGKKGALVAINPQNGEILALVSQPAYDPNLFVNGIGHADYNALQTDPGRPLYNRAIRGQYPPASTIKPFMAIAGLESNFADPHRYIQDPGFYIFNGSHYIYRDWKKEGHGKVDLSRAISVSCDTYFYDLAVRMGVERISSYLQKFGFGEPTGIEMYEELPGLLPTPIWKKKTHGQSWFPGDTIVLGIGQGYWLTTPLQLAQATATLANRGKRIQPHLLLKQRLPNHEEWLTPIRQIAEFQSSNQYWDYIHRAMQQVITQGTASRYGSTPYTLAGKTGTAQVANIPRLKALYGEHVPENLRDNTLFIAFAPVEMPKIAVAAVVENSSQALEVVRDVIHTYLKEPTHEQTRSISKPEN